MRAFMSLYSASMKEFVRDRTSLGFTVILPLMLVIFFGFAYHATRSDVRIGLVGAAGHGPLATRLDKLAGVSVESGSLSEERGRLSSGSVDIVVSISRSASTRRIYYAKGSPALRLAAREVARLVTNGKASGAGPQPRPASSVSSSRLDFVVPGILATAVMWLGIFSAIPLVQQREQQVLRRFAVTPVPTWLLIAAQLLGRLAVSVLQAAFILVAARLLFGVPIVAVGQSWLGQSGSLLVLVLLGACCFVSLGYAIAALNSTQYGAHAWAQLISMPMLFLAAVFFPVGVMPLALKPLVAVFPLTYLADALRHVAHVGPQFAPVSVDLIVLLAWTAVSLSVAVRYFRWT